MIGFIGAGNMTKAILSGMIKKEIQPSNQIIVSRRNEEALRQIKDEFQVEVTTDNKEVAKKSAILIFAVKPQFLQEVIREVKEDLREDQLIISIAAGKSISWLEQELGNKTKIIRCMPNTPLLVLEGATGICKNTKVKQEEVEQIRTLFECMGSAYIIEERLMDAQGAVCGSSPAFVFMFMEALADAAVLGGIPRNTAYEMAAQSVMGSAKLMLESKLHPGVLKDQVCSPGGTTIEGVKVLEEMGMKAAVMNAVEACIDKSKRL
ncbi:MAG: pyrroline-5-carboxylate reductase [Lachnospiraceae bacterium]